MEEHLSELESRLCQIEQRVNCFNEDLRPAVRELKDAVEDIRRRLEEAEASFWLVSNCRGTMGRSDLGGVWPLTSVHPYWRHVKYRRKVESEINEVVFQFKNMCESEIREETKNILRLPSFNTWAWEDGQLLLLLQHMYQDLGLTTRFSIESGVIGAFLCTTYLHYNQVPFHNFRHAFSVAQMMYGMVCKCDLQRRLGDLNILILLTSCICHDLDHPGFNNIYQINAKTELALRYNDISPLENHHCAVAFSILENDSCNILRNLTPDEYKMAREGIIRCILATDMARHNEILQDFLDVVFEFDFDNKDHVNLLFMMLIKVADISNEARPLDIAEPWLECLMQEFFNQSDLEKLEGLPVSPFMDRDKVTKPSSQCSFIGFVLLPLFEALGKVLTELEDLIIQPVKEALEYYRRLNEGTKKTPSGEEAEEEEEEEEDEEEANKEFQGKVDNEAPLSGSQGGDGDVVGSPSSPSNLKRILSKTESFTSLRSRASSKTSAGLVRGASSRETDTEVDPPETEVEVSERTSKFKISTEASRRNSYDRKGSTERTISPRLLEERLRPHAEMEAEKLQPSPSERDEDDNKDRGSPLSSSSILDRIKYFSGRRTADKYTLVQSDSDTSRTGWRNVGDSLGVSLISPKKSNHHGVLKRKDATEVWDPQPSLTAISKTHISFASQESAKVASSTPSSPLQITKDDRERPDGTKPVAPLALQVEVSPTHSERTAASPTTSVLRHKKKFSLSLDVLPRRNGRSNRKDPSQRVSSDDLLSGMTSQDAPKRPCQNNSPKLMKKKHESARAIFLRSLSFKRRSAPSSGKDACDSPTLHVASPGPNTQDLL